MLCRLLHVKWPREIQTIHTFINRYLVCILCVQVKEVELKPDGKDIPVMEMNKKEYVEYVMCNVCGCFI